MWALVLLFPNSMDFQCKYLGSSKYQDSWPPRLASSQTSFCVVIRGRFNQSQPPGLVSCQLCGMPHRRPIKLPAHKSDNHKCTSRYISKWAGWLADGRCGQITRTMRTRWNFLITSQIRVHNLLTGNQLVLNNNNNAFVRWNCNEWVRTEQLMNEDDNHEYICIHRTLGVALKEHLKGLFTHYLGLRRGGGGLSNWQFMSMNRESQSLE